jgi:heme-degrading monooxygenase HmoA
MGQPVTLINAFTVPPEESERFLERWKGTARFMSDRPGFVRARMYRATSDDAELRFVNVAEWESREALDDAIATPEFRATVERILGAPDLHVIPRPAVYQVAVEVRPGAPL